MTVDHNNPKLPEATLWGHRWRHVKSGRTYRVTCLGILENDLKPCVIYRAEDGGPVWVRPHAEFVDGRFVCIDQEETPDDR